MPSPCLSALGQQTACMAEREGVLGRWTRNDEPTDQFTSPTSSRLRGFQNASDGLNDEHNLLHTRSLFNSVHPCLWSSAQISNPPLASIPAWRKKHLVEVHIRLKQEPQTVSSASAQLEPPLCVLCTWRAAAVCCAQLMYKRASAWDRAGLQSMSLTETASTTQL